MRLFTLVSLLTLSLPTFAAPNCPDFMRAYPEDCSLYNRYQDVKQKFEEEYALDIEEIVRYRALRFIAQYNWDWDKAKNKNTTDFRPWEIYAPVPTTWAFWERGDAYIQSFLGSENATLTSSDIQEMHHAVMDELIIGTVSDTGKGADPGKYRSKPVHISVKGVKSTTPSWKSLCEKPWSVLNKDELELIKNYDLADAEGRPLVTVKDESKIKYCESLKAKGEFYEFRMLYYPSPGVADEVDRFASTLSDQWKRMLRGASGQGPISFIADMQRWFISIHPFGDGNGRVSRLIQDLLAKSFGLPYPPSGKISRDVSRTKEQYRQDMLKFMKETVGELEKCYADYNKNFQYVPYGSSPDYKTVSGDCRPIYYNDGALKLVIGEMKKIPFFKYPKKENKKHNKRVKKAFKAYFKTYPEMKKKKEDNL